MTASHIHRALKACGLAALVAASAPAQAGSGFATFEPAAGAAPRGVQVAGLDRLSLSLDPEAARPAIVHFFASWCEPCKDEIPELASFAGARVEGVRTVMVAVFDQEAKVRKLVGPLAGLPPIGLDPDRRAARAFGVSGLPATILIAPDGARSLIARGPVDWNGPAAAAALDSIATSKQEKPQGAQQP